MLLNILFMYLVGAMISFGLVYTLNSYGFVEEITVGFYLNVFLCSWLSVAAFGLGVLRGFVSVFRG